MKFSHAKNKSILKYLEVNLKNKHDLKRAGVKKVPALVHVYALIVYLRG
jgi:hypothetical protein